MSERVRLRLSGEAAPSALPVLAEPRPLECVALVAAHEGVDLEPMARALASRGAPRWRAVVRQRAGSEIVEAEGETIVRASADELERALDALPAGRRAVAIGAAFVALRRPVLAILVTGGAGPVQWSPELRALRHRFELVLTEPRIALAHRLADALLGS